MVNDKIQFCGIFTTFKQIAVLDFWKQKQNKKKTKRKKKEEFSQGGNRGQKMFKKFVSGERLSVPKKNCYTNIDCLLSEDLIFAEFLQNVQT